MNKVIFARNLFAKGLGNEHRSLLAAFIDCLSSEETCELLLSTFEIPYLDRFIVLKKIGRDLVQKHEECHSNLISELVEILADSTGNRKQNCATCLSYLFDFATPSNQEFILRALITSDRISLRQRACKKLRKTWHSKYSLLVEETWQKYKDREVAEVIIDHFDDNFLELHLYELVQQVVNSWHFTKLFLRLGKTKPAKLRLLEQFDLITYSYVLVKLNKRLTPPKALRIYDQCRNDKRIGLLIWCFGRMRLWATLLKIADTHSEYGADHKCNKCDNGALLPSGHQVNQVPFGKVLLQVQLDIYRCFSCEATYSLCNGEFLEFEVAEEF